MDALSYVYTELQPTLETYTETIRVNNWSKIFELLLEYGASLLQTTMVAQRFGTQTRSRTISIITVLREVFSKWDIEGAERLDGLLPTNLAGELRRNAGIVSLAPSPTILYST